MAAATEMMGVEEARECLLSHIETLDVETVPLLQAVGRVAGADLVSDCDITPFDHAAMDGFAVRTADLAPASEANPVSCQVVAEVPAGSVYNGPIEPGQVVRIMTGAPVPAAADAVVKYEIVDYGEGDGRQGSTVSFSQPAKPGENIRSKGEEIAQGDVAIHAGEAVSAAGVGFLASCGIVEVPVYRRPRVAVIAIGSELLPPTQPLAPGCIRDSNSYAMAACVAEAGGIPACLPIVADDLDELAHVIQSASQDYDFIVTTGGASNGDYDFIKPVVERLGTLYMTLVNMRPGKAQTFGLVNGTPVFGLPGNPAAAFCGFEVLVRQALRKMQGFAVYERPTVKARLVGNRKKKDPRRIYLRAVLSRNEDGSLSVAPAKNQSSGLFSTIQRANCLAILPEGTSQNPVPDGTLLDCMLLDVPEGTVL